MNHFQKPNFHNGNLFIVIKQFHIKAGIATTHNEREQLMDIRGNLGS
jgi:hypothetical protein